ncbi:peptidoglycan DD-metalloendopeptidase family protein [Dethiothermospora halolimnae]|uniref:peptidoglycan DD-metalloendopeptidase family protein n=1 Tax=Dethiothermospora halolimnae TaxID=3114390 RepID=UPI003CCBAACF
MSIRKKFRRESKGFKVNRRHSNSEKEKNFYRQQFKKLLISIIIVLFIIIIKKFDTEPTKKIIKIVSNTLNYNMDIKEDGKKILDYGKHLSGISDKVISIFKVKEEEEYIFPVNGKIYEKFGKEKKSNGVTVFHKGISILTQQKEVLSMDKGKVIEVGENRLIGKFVKIQHGGFEAVYGYLHRINAIESQNVDKGEKIGEIKDEGKKILYLETRKKGKAVDPMTILSNITTYGL